MAIKKSRKTTTISVSIEPEIKRFAEEKAAQQDKSLSAFMRTLLRDHYLKEMELLELQQA